MKSKTKTYLLLVAVFSVWGIIAFKILTTLNPEQPKMKQHDHIAEFIPKEYELVDTFSIQLPDRDPFLGTLNQKGIKQEQVRPTKQQAIEWLPIIYNGLISKQDSKEKICVLSIDGRQRILKVGQVIDGVKLLKANSNEVLLGYKGQTKTVPKT